MPNNEEQHKTWRMLKKASPIRVFDIKSCPYADVNWTVDNKNNGMGTNNLGTWKCTTANTYGNYNCKNAWTPADDKWAFSGFEIYRSNTLELPVGVEIKLSTVNIHYWTAATGTRNARFRFHAFNSSTNAWELLYQKEVNTAPGILEITVNKDAYYSKLCVEARQRASGSNDVTCVEYVDIPNGSLRLDMSKIN